MFTKTKIKGFCSGLEKVDSSVGTIYRPTIDAADTVTILVTALLDCLSYPAKDETMTNGDAIFALLADLTGMEELAGAYPAIAEIIAGIDYEYADLNWGYMFNEGDVFTPGQLPAQSIVYLGYNTDWTKDAADGVYDALGAILDMVLPSVLEENQTIGTLIDGLLNDNVYSDANLTAIVELLVNAIALLPSLIYFINADGLKASVNNLLAPVNAVLDCLSGLVGEVSIGSLLADAIGMDICNINIDTLLAFATDAGVVVNDEMVYVLKNLYVGTPAKFESATGRDAYRVAYNEGNPAHEMLTILLSLALDAFNINADLFSDLLGADMYNAVYNLIRGAQEEFTYISLNWGYMYEGATNAEKLAALQAANGVLPERTNVAYDVYTTYQNNWNKQTADYITVAVDTLVHDITTAVTSNGSSLGQILDEAIADGLYQDSLLNDLVEMVVDLLVDYAGIIEGAGVLLGAESIVNWIDYCEITEDEDGNRVVTCTHDWGIDEAETIDEKRELFIDAFATVLEPTYEVLAWLFFGEKFTFFNGTTNEALITLKGGKGYTEALVPLFEAVGVLMKRDAEGKLLSVEDTYLNGETAVLPESYFYVNGELDMELAVKTIFGAVTDWLYDICGDLGEQSTDGVITSMLERLPNLLYAINADGLRGFWFNS